MSEPYEVREVMRLREVPQARREVRLGSDDRTAHRAYPHLSRLWQDKGDRHREAVLHFGALAATHARVRHSSGGRPFGRVLASVAGGDTTSRRLLAVQTMDLDDAHTQVSSLMTRLVGATIDWTPLWCAYADWNHPEETRSRRARRGLLEQFYAREKSE